MLCRIKRRVLDVMDSALLAGTRGIIRHSVSVSSCASSTTMWRNGSQCHARSLHAMLAGRGELSGRGVPRIRRG